MFFDSAVTLAAMLTPGVFVSGDFTAIRGDDVGYDPTAVLEAAIDGELEVELPVDAPDATPEDIGDVDDDVEYESDDLRYEEQSFMQGSVPTESISAWNFHDSESRQLISDERDRGHGNAKRNRTGPQWAKHRDFGPGEVRKLRRDRRRRYTVVVDSI